MNPEDEVKRHFSERMKNPFFGYFVVTFVIFHWQQLFLLVSGDGTATERLAVWNEYYSHWSILWVIMVAIFIMVITPYLALVTRLMTSHGRMLFLKFSQIEDNYHNNQSVRSRIIGQAGRFHDAVEMCEDIVNVLTNKSDLLDEQQVRNSIEYIKATLSSVSGNLNKIVGRN